MLSVTEPDLSTKGIVVATSRENRVADAINEVRVRFVPEQLGMVVTFFSPKYDAEELTKAFTEAFGPVPVVGCSTAGEITPEGMSDESLVVIGFSKDDFTIVTRPLLGLSSLSMRTMQEIAADAVRELNEMTFHVPQTNAFALLLVDGLSHLEERLASAICGGLMDIPLIGGSAGDGLRFKKTHVIHGGRVHSDAAVLVLIQCPFKLMTFSFTHFSPTPKKLVVTSADVEQRIVREFNGAPAAEEYAAAVGLTSEITPMSFAAHPIAVCVGGGYYVRSIRRVNEDGSLSFFCAIDEGIVVSVAEANDIVKCAERTFENIRANIGKPSLVLGFECVLRRVESELRQTSRPLSKIYKDNNVVGFHAYGEQFNTLHLNQTFSGIAIGK